ncbi:hypothetical protein CHARACLAT_017450 [Characodon lateralis]|uniref:Uncharacterized protein n=1 Tax=Characodon lateralis TaxID=208331 RepID=A0ABU7EEP7_9TELE|nr:hypothetical protein [Characodon lateralis]
MALYLPHFHNGQVFTECTTNSCPVNLFSHLGCASMPLHQSDHSPHGCFSDKFSLCQPASLGGLTCFDRFPVVPYSLHFSDDRLNNLTCLKLGIFYNVTLL